MIGSKIRLLTVLDWLYCSRSFHVRVSRRCLYKCVAQFVSDETSRGWVVKMMAVGVEWWRWWQSRLSGEDDGSRGWVVRRWQSGFGWVVKMMAVTVEWSRRWQSGLSGQDDGSRGWVVKMMAVGVEWSRRWQSRLSGEDDGSHGWVVKMMAVVVWFVLSLMWQFSTVVMCWSRRTKLLFAECS